MGEIAEFVKTSAQRDGLDNLSRGQDFFLDGLKPSRNGDLIKDFTYKNEALLTGRAIQLGSDTGMYAIEFDITTDKPQPSSEHNAPLRGEIGERLYCIAERPGDSNDKFRVAIGVIENREGVKIINLTGWHPIESRLEKSKIYDMLKSNKLKAPQPFTTPASDLTKVKFTLI